MSIYVGNAQSTMYAHMCMRNMFVCSVSSNYWTGILEWTVNFSGSVHYSHTQNNTGQGVLSAMPKNE